MTLLDIRTRVFAPAQSFPFTDDDDTSSLRVHILAYIFVGLGLLSIVVSLFIYFRNMSRIVSRKIVVGHGWAGYSMVLSILLFVVFVMAAAIAV